jgi:hypothetical protein
LFSLFKILPSVLDLNNRLPCQSKEKKLQSGFSPKIAPFADQHDGRVKSNPPREASETVSERDSSGIGAHRGDCETAHSAGDKRQTKIGG